MRTESPSPVRSNSRAGPSPNAAVYILIVTCAAVGLFLAIADLAEHQRRARLAIELALCVPATLLWARKHIHLRH